MKSKKMIILCALLGISFAAAGTVSYIHSEVEAPKKAEAAETDSKDYIFLKPTNWISDGARFAVYYYLSGTQDGWVSMSNDGIDVEMDDGTIKTYKDVDDTIYHALVPTGRNYIFCRMKPNTENNWDNKWNQTSDLKDYDLSKTNYFEIAVSTNYSGISKVSSMKFLTDTSTRDIYINSSAVHPYVYAFGSSTLYYGANENVAFPGAKATLVKDSIYKATFYSCYDKIIFTDGKTENTQQTANISLITKDASSTNGNIQGYTLHSTWTYSYGLISESPMTTSNFVLYLNRNKIYDYGYSYSFHYWNDNRTINHEIFPLHVELTPGEWYAKFVISSEAIGCNSQFKVYSSSGSFIIASAKIEYKSTFNNGEAQASKPNENTLTISYSQKSSKESDAATAAKILSNYYSCLNNDYNGFAQIDKLCTNWGFSSTTADIDTTMMDDYATTDDYGTTNKTSSVSVGAKIAEMKRMSEIAKANSVNISNMVFGNDNTNVVSLITIASLIALASLAVIILRKRHLNNNN